MTAELSIQNTNFITPVHVAIIMDGNGRWAKARGLPRVSGHKEGAAAVKLTIQLRIWIDSSDYRLSRKSLFTLLYCI